MAYQPVYDGLIRNRSSQVKVHLDFIRRQVADMLAMGMINNDDATECEVQIVVLYDPPVYEQLLQVFPRITGLGVRLSVVGDAFELMGLIKLAREALSVSDRTQLCELMLRKAREKQDALVARLSGY